MPQYRFSPTRAGRHWWAVFGVAAVLLALPALLNLLVPDNEDRVDEVRLGQLGYDWEIPLTDAAGEPVACRKSTDVINGYLWDCDGTLVHSMIVEGSNDEEETLRRMMRMEFTQFPPRDIPTFREGESRMVLDDRFGAVGMSLPGTGDRESQSMIAIIYGGAEVPELADAAWYRFTDGQPLPMPVLMLLEGMSDGAPSPGSPEVPMLENITEAV